MEGRGSAAGLLAVVAMALVLVMAPGALAANHVVGGSQQWNIPTSNAQYYTTWAANQTFAAGDTLQFEYSASAHDVVQYNSSAEYTACAGTAVHQYQTGNDSITLPAAGTYYFICTITGHCAQGMKVSVTVGAAASPPTTTPSPPGTTPSPPPPTGTNPPPSAASSGPVLSMAGLLIAALVASLAFLV